MKSVLKIIAPLYVVLSFQACSPVKGYPGPERPDNEVSVIEVMSMNDVSVSEDMISGVEIGLAGIAVLPGNQEFSATATISENPYNCRPYSEFNSYGFHDCEKDARKGNSYSYCDCFDYLSIYESCEQVVKEGACRASFTTQAGQKYEIAVGMNMGAPVVKVREKSTLKEVGSGNCTKDGQRVEQVNNYIGQGRSVANQAGFYSCYGY